jgi:2-oxoglutarate dehydrogenase N-terminus
MALRAVAGRLAARLQPAPLAVFGGRWIHGTDKAEQQHPKPVPLPKLKDSFLDGTSSTYLEELEERYRADPGSVDKSWASFFRSLGAISTCIHIVCFGTDIYLT